MCEWNALQSKGFIFRNGTSLCNSAESVLVSGPLSDLSFCHLHGSDTLANHSYVDLSIKSHYDLITCCNGFGVFNVETGISPVPELDCHLLVTFVRVMALKLFLKTMLSHLVVLLQQQLRKRDSLCGTV